MVLDMLTAAELDQLHAKLVSGTIRLAEELIAGCQNDMHRVSGWFTGSPEHAVLKASLGEQAELTAEILAEIRVRQAGTALLAAAAAADAANPYEQACDRMETARRNCREAKVEAERILRETEDEYAAALDNLRQYESQPGIPRPEYR